MSTFRHSRPFASIRGLLKQSDGPLTQDLVQKPGNFGLGKIPARLAPTSTVTSVCGYCATGCQLKLHLFQKRKTTFHSKVNPT